MEGFWVLCGDADCVGHFSDGKHSSLGTYCKSFDNLRFESLLSFNLIGNVIPNTFSHVINLPLIMLMTGCRTQRFNQLLPLLLDKKTLHLSITGQGLTRCLSCSFRTDIPCLGEHLCFKIICLCNCKLLHICLFEYVSDIVG